MSNLAVPAHYNGFEIAIIGMSGRFPGARDIHELWQNLRDGVESIAFFTDEELTSSGIDLSVLSAPDYVKARGVLEDAELFDASFFGFTPSEAEVMDPQHRIFLECAWEALEHAGYDGEEYQGSIGVYGGAGTNTYQWNNLYPNRDIMGLRTGLQTRIGNEKDYLATRVSYLLNLDGPSVAVQSTCSTSLVAVHLACQSLLGGECDMALAGGVSINVPQQAGYVYQEEGIYSPDGHCRAFDARAQGTVFGNGVGIVVLKRLQDALRGGDCIHAVIKGSAINNDGSSKVGYAAPSVAGQAKVIARALAMADIDPATISYIETHGTGTALGDPIEIAALTRTFRAITKKQSFCAIGSVKTNVGHLSTAAGVTGLIKTVLALKHKMIPPSLHFEQPNPQIDFANSPFYVNRRLSDWSAGEGEHPRRAGVSAFGIGGTNAHVILEEAPPSETAKRSRPWQMLMLSAKTPSALETATTNLAEHFKQHPQVNLADVAYTLQVGRRAFKHRRMLVCHGLEDAQTALETRNPHQVLTDVQEFRDRPVVFMFPGQGAQYVPMAFNLYEAEPTFRAQVDLCSDLLTPQLGLDLRKVLYPTSEQFEEANQQLQQTWLTQPALFVIEYALAKLWMAWGIHPQAMIGHSIGEYVAACLAGVFSLEDALALVATRGRLMQELPSGAMLAVPLPEEEVQSFLGQNLALAAINAPSLCVVSGPTASVDALQERLTDQGVSCLRVHTSHAFHSAMMEPILEPFTQQVTAVNLGSPAIPFVSNVTGTWITAVEAGSPGYWARHLRHTVRFAAGLHELLKEPDRILLEVGPGRTMTTLARRHPGKAPGQVVLSSVRHPQAQGSDVAFILTTLGQLWLAGIPVKWLGLYAGERRQRLPLPTYPFERQRYWVEPQKPEYKANINRRLLRKEPDIANWFYLPSWKRSVAPMLLDQGIPADQRSCWLVFSDTRGVGSQIILRLEQLGQDVIQVRAGAQFGTIGEHLYEINPREPEHYHVLLKLLRGMDKSPDQIVHLWSVTTNDSREIASELSERDQDLGFYSLLFLAQALGEQTFEKPVHIGVISETLQSVTGEEILYPEKATVLGPCKVIPQEYPNIVCRSIDVVIPPPESHAQEMLVSHLIAELTTNRLDAVVAYRGNQRWVQTFEAVRLEKPVGGASRLRQDGVYLITGGLGGVGLVLAKYLAQAVQARLVLIGRTAFPERESWDQWLGSHDDHDAVSRKIREVQAIERCGGEVIVISADVANYHQIQEAIQLTYERFGPIHGVIHAAGIAGGGIIQLKTPEMAARVLAPKVQGTEVLNTLFGEMELDFLILCSSISSIVGGSGQVDYCGANSFLDAFAFCHNSSNGRLVVSINWDTWQEVGMAVNTAVPKDREAWRQETLKRGIMSSEGMDVFERILGTTVSQVIVATRDFRSDTEWSDTHPPSPTAEEVNNVTLSISAHPRPDLGSPYIAPRDTVEQTIADIWQELLGLDRVGIHDSFLNLGGHSLIALQVIARLRRAFQVEVSVRALLEEPTVAGLAAAVAKAKGNDATAQTVGIVPVPREGYRMKADSPGVAEGIRSPS